ncbi:MAG: exodeoxyribonuclease VII large subunit [Rhizobiaceae bacterium]|nr:exodeoxyribonuclease VII large subunit [Rhizobiaceae bacterium]
MTVFETDSATNLVEYTVTELSGSIKRTVESAFDQVRVRGEISGYRGPHSSGHAYFALKDDRARLEAVIWKGTFSRLRTRPEEGMEVIATGKITTFPGSSKYQIVIESLEPAGVGALMALLEERKRKLQSEGLFDAARKQLLPFMPSVIGVVTSPTGAVIRDILHRISDRFPLHVLVWPVRVQGEGAGAEVANAIRGFNELEAGGAVPRPDVLIVARGGGSLEDLWCFNDEVVVRAAAGSGIPLIAAVGHETDWTLIDYAADQRAPTPTGAAEMAVPVKAELEALLAGLAARLSRAMSRQMDIRRREVRDLARALPSLDQVLALPRRRFDEAASRLARGLEMTTVNKRRSFERVSAHLRPDILSSRISDHRRRLAERMAGAERSLERLFERLRRPLARADAVLAGFPARFHIHTERQRDRLGHAARRSDGALTALLSRHRQSLGAQDRILQSLSYRNVLKRGYAVIRGDGDRVLSSAGTVSAGDRLSIEFHDGAVAAIAGADDGVPTPTPAKKRSSSRAIPDKGNQGSLF